MSITEIYTAYDDTFDILPEDQDICFESDHAPFEIEHDRRKTAAEVMRLVPETIVPAFDLETRIKEKIV